MKVPMGTSQAGCPGPGQLARVPRCIAKHQRPPRRAAPDAKAHVSSSSNQVQDRSRKRSCTLPFRLNCRGPASVVSLQVPLYSEAVRDASMGVTKCAGLFGPARERRGWPPATMPGGPKRRWTISAADTTNCVNDEVHLRATAAKFQRWIRAEPPFANALTCSTDAMVVSPGYVVRSAPCAQPSLTASSGDSPVRRP